MQQLPADEQSPPAAPLSKKALKRARDRGFHARFAAALREFSPWIAELIELDQATGVAAVVATYEELLTSRPGPNRSKVLSW